MGREKRSSDTYYVSERCETNTSEDCYELVKEMLKKLSESERTIIILYYLGKMTTGEISKSLGVSVSTIVRRLQQARELLQDDEIFLIQEILGSVQISEDLVHNVMRKISNIKPTSFSVRKRFFFIF
ncbi:hypothetical protein C6496_10730 [Candidatus Poribacteria bacterium]|nr:MAG: hypothetical protein C6496_10730 [Candidatus Poribacteria bacterium]